ncbi:hypothetical protein lerEdw1_020906, partial [Lerista edwardsae]
AILHIFHCLSVIAAYGLKCQYCQREEPGTGCQYPKDVCYTHPKGYCMSISVYLRGRLKYRMEGCTKQLITCMKDKNYRIGIRVSIFCCQYDLCNHWERDRDET